MSSEIKADKWSPASGTSATIGDSGDTYTIPSGVTLANSGTVTGLPASSISSGTIATARLGSGTASSSTVLYGDGTFKAEPGGGLTLVSSGTGSDVSNLNIDSVFTNSYKAYKFVGGFRPATNGEDLWFVYRSGGSNSGNSEYRYIVQGFIAEGSQSSDARQYAWGNPYWKISTNSPSNNSNYMQYVDMNIWNPMATSTTFGGDYTSASGNSMLYMSASGVVYSAFAMNYQTGGNYDGLHITFASGNINAYNYQIYGYNPT
tara:strand:- start:686 stop:1468 length:783 start_codon:yes stop_codon:yes gene_type:complete